MLRLVTFVLPSYMRNIHMILEMLVLFVYMCRRYASFFWRRPTEEAALGRFLWTKASTRYGHYMILYQLFILLSLLLYRIGSGDGSYISTQAIYDEHEGIHYDRVLQWFLVSPVLEELVFRVLVFHVLYNRVPNPRPVRCVLVSAVIFGLSHLENTIGVGMSPSQLRYAIVQIGIGCVAGTLFGLRFLLAHPSVLESLCLHVLNNIIAVLWLHLDVISLLSSGDLFVWLALANTCVFYGVSIVVSLTECSHWLSRVKIYNNYYYYKREFSRLDCGDTMRRPCFNKPFFLYDSSAFFRSFVSLQSHKD